MKEERLRELEGRVQLLEDKDSIRGLAVRCGNYIDRRDPVGMRSVFTDDVRFYSKNGSLDLNGVDETVDFLTTELNKVSKRSLHVQHGHIVELDPGDPDLATGTQFGHSEGVAHDPQVGVKLAAVRYEDIYRRVEEGWKIAERCVSFFYQVEASNYLQDVASDTPVQGPESLPADF